MRLWVELFDEWLISITEMTRTITSSHLPIHLPLDQFSRAVTGLDGNDWTRNFKQINIILGPLLLGAWNRHWISALIDSTCKAKYNKGYDLSVFYISFLWPDTVFTQSELETIFSLLSHRSANSKSFSVCRLLYWVSPIFPEFNISVCMGVCVSAWRLWAQFITVYCEKRHWYSLVVSWQCGETD